MKNSGSQALRARTSQLGQWRCPCGQHCLHVGTLVLVLDPRVLGQKTSRNEFVSPCQGWASTLRPKAGAAVHTDHRGTSWGWASSCSWKEATSGLAQAPVWARWLALGELAGRKRTQDGGSKVSCRAHFLWPVYNSCVQVPVSTALSQTSICRCLLHTHH